MGRGDSRSRNVVEQVANRLELPVKETPWRRFSRCTREGGGGGGGGEGGRG